MRAMLTEDARLAPAARTLWEIQRACGALSIEAASNLYNDVRSRAARALALGDERRAQVKDASTLKAYQEYTLKAFLNCVGGVPDLPKGAPARVLERREYEHFRLEKVLLEPFEGSYATANVYTPKRLTARAPAVLITVGHSDLGKADPEYQYVAQMLAHAGFVTLVLDPLGEGERFEHYEPDIDLQPIQGCSGEHDLLDWKCKLMGLSLSRYFIADGLCALEYLASREDVDAARVAITGHSGGGTQVCMLTLVAGRMLAAAAPCAYVTDTRAMLECGVDPDNEMLWQGSVAAGLDYVDMLAGVAPKPVLFLCNKHDFFPREGALRTLDKAIKLWSAAGSAVMPAMAEACSGHAYTRGLALEATRFFSLHLLGKTAELSDFEFAPLPAEDLRVTRQGSLLKAYPDMRTLHARLLDELRARKAKRGDVACEAAWLVNAAGYTEDAERPAPLVLSEGVCAHYAYRVMAWRPEEGYWNTGVLLRDMRAGDKALPTVIALWQEGLERLAEHSQFIYGVVRAGCQVLVMDVAASGTLKPALIANANMRIGWGTMYKLNAYLIQLGDSLVGLRVRHAARAARMLGALPGARSVTYYGEGEFARYALLAALITRAPVYTDGAYQEYEDIVLDKYHDQTHTPDWAFPGVLNHFDMRHIRKRLGELGLLARDPREPKDNRKEDE